MRKVIGILLLSSFIGIAVFGFIAMGHTLTHGGCIASAAQGMNGCMEQGTGTGSVFFHLKIFKSFSQALITSALLALIASFILLGRVMYFNANEIDTTKGQSISFFTIMNAQIWMRARGRFTRWLALHESSENYAPQWVHGIEFVAAGL
ncbi:hypothetical protein A3B21_03795 [Candidatus Uhrbacteria bacterium RIFCSPLOWO2_01_FULL_47_24]|uniref:Uncharacterized protein n=1 Tax=Candidatus Uhrbacteria bacterium RIFCSPLOWO2_01_FULL_47_24 TaxID=1802401 RepID=A0A1F7URE5_9BACT|nr:MAG: hypothetical protein A2753_01520 [Candidatus Uhrbacteria bacterium RIFCSPHIGHO2_01_FULL_47_11]OGL68554.1 MAG: hypothetical protein A3D58_02395 [Candidatus Uhrbacteria bacterium RIFCSPHIGHO2_02_FULL_46_47]OGL75491.1 MAG: hypothetical protein A3F52_04270 [Candidatus Uhrbacteria bacterium RIFCSPHIGHO2_12_FULL_47_11]OGL80862.1 MAG: hypothetical protein A3B21_03795 [Candidatus Uhrbacteria bacterium RIFCSPLOWO2_01_FULL_47_24]OGL84760.1 MAG: hypothetical protein A3J03_01150 [Candidatus Uhrbact